MDRTLPPPFTAGDHLRHWLRDGGSKALRDGSIVAVACLVLCSFGVVSLVTVYLATPAPPKPKPPIYHVIDGKRGPHDSR